MTSRLFQFVAMFAVEIFSLHLFFKWIERRWPERPQVDVSHLDADARKRVAKRADRVGTLSALASVPFLWIGWGLGFWALQRWAVPSIPGARFVRLPSLEYHFLIGMVAALVLSGSVGYGVLRLVYRGHLHQVMAVGDTHFGFDVRKLMYATFVWIVPLCVDAEALLMGRFVIFTDHGVHSRGLLERRPVFRPYSDVVALYGVDLVNVVRREKRFDHRFSIVFRDGAAVPSPRFLYHDDRPEDIEALRLAERKSGVPIRWGTDLP